MRDEPPARHLAPRPHVIDILRGMTEIRALLFDVFGTVVDWRSGVAREVEALASTRGIDVDGGDFADRVVDGVAHFHGHAVAPFWPVERDRGDIIAQIV